jgi:hypothetical protein
MSAIRLRLGAVILILLALVGACALLPDGALHPTGGLFADASPGPEGLPYPSGCGAFGFSAQRCEKVVHELAQAASVDVATVRAIQLLPDPGCGGDPRVLCTRSASIGARGRLTLADGSTTEATVWCGVGSQGLYACSEAPTVLR